MDYLYHLLAGAQALHHLGADCALLDPADEIAGHSEVDVGFQERQANLAERLVYVALSEATLAR